MYNMFDEDNIDLEEQMYLRDVQEEMGDYEEDNSDDNTVNDDTEEESVYEYKLTRLLLDTEIPLKDSKKTILTFTHKKTGKIYKGVVMGKSATDKDKYVFKVSEILEDEETQVKTKIFNFTDIKKYS